MKIYHKHIRSFFLLFLFLRIFDSPFIRKECSNIFPLCVQIVVYQLADEITEIKEKTVSRFIFANASSLYRFPIQSFCGTYVHTKNTITTYHSIFFSFFSNWNGIFLYMSFGLFLFFFKNKKNFGSLFSVRDDAK